MRTEQYSNKRIAIYSQDGFGLGHMRRTNAIAREILHMNADASILTLSDSPLGQFFSIPANHDYIKLPSIVKNGPGHWQASNLAVSFDEVLEMRQQLILSALKSFAPDVLLVDHMPHGAMGELVPALDALKAMGTQMVLGLRDILDDPSVILRRWAVEGAFEAIEQYYSRVLIYGMREVFDLTSQYQFPEALVDRVNYCGYVCNQDQPLNSARVRANFLTGARAGTKLIVAMAGGGADAYPMMRNLLDAVERIHKEQDCSVAMITGPFMPAHLSADLNQRAQKLPVRMIESVDDSLSYIAAADLVVAMAGYNTSVEILRMRRPAILIPRAGPSAEQRMRSRLFAARRWVDYIDPDDLTPERLGQKILSRWHRSIELRPYLRPDLRGVTLAANQILALLYRQQEPEPVKVRV